MPFVTETDRAGPAEAHFSRRAVAVVIACLGLLLLAGVAAGFIAYKATVAERRVEHTLQVREEALDLMGTALVMQGSVRGYLLTEDQSFLEPYEGAVTAVPTAVDRLLELTADNPSQQAAIETVRSTLGVLVDRYREMIAAAGREGRDATIDLVGNGAGEELMGAVRERIESVADEELRLLGQRQAAADRLRLLTLLLVFGALLAATALAALLGHWMLHYVNRLVLQTAELEKETRRRRDSEANLVQAQKMEAVGQLAGGIAHDFNNMLTIIVGNVSTVLRRLRQEGEAASSAVPPLEAAMQGAEAAAKLTHRLLAFSRRQPLAPSQVDLNRVVSGVIDLVRRSIGESIELETVLAAGLWPTFADRHQLENVLVNLVVNGRTRCRRADA
jgi:CHASE3 domain sensor protein